MWAALRGGARLEDVCEIEKGRALGKGSFGTVYRGRLRKERGGGVVAVKVLDKRKMTELKVPAALVESETGFMRECNGKDSFVQLYHFIETSTAYNMVMEFCDGGNLEEAAKACDGKLREAQVVCVIRQILGGIVYLHSRRICHRDIKPQNIMMLGSLISSRVKIKIADFGIAVRVKHATVLTEKVGTPAFMAPEMHLLPAKSAGYDEMVDMWALGCVLVFLLAYEYPFVDASGRLLQDQLLRGDLPIWNTDVFSSLFQRVQVAAGMRKRMPSSCARAFIRELLHPKRKNRITAIRALEHPWFKPGTDYEDRGDDLPLLEWKDFEEGFLGIDRELQRVAAGVVERAAGVADAMGNVQIAVSGCDQPICLDPTDERLDSCVVCYNSTGSLGYVCPQCHYSVCLPCLQKLPKSECPHCRAEAKDVAITQKVARFARKMTADTEAVMEASEAALHAGLDAALEAGASEHLGMVARDVAVHLDVPNCGPRSEAEHLRRTVCHLCQQPSSATSHVCPLCHTSVCFPCARKELSSSPRCPHCGDVSRNATELREFLAAGEAWSNFAALPQNLGMIGKHATSLMGRLGLQTSSSSSSSKAFPTLNIGDPGSPQNSSVKRRLSVQAQLDLHHDCHFCRRESSSLDLSCCRCGTTVCTGCASASLLKDSCCPNCKDPEFCNAQTLSLLAHAAQVQDSAQSFWKNLVGVGMDFFASNNLTDSVPQYHYARFGDGPSHHVRGSSGRPPQVLLPLDSVVASTSVIAL